MFIVRIRQPATYAMCVNLFFCYFWVTLPGAPHLLNCAETNGGIVKQKVVSDLESSRADFIQCRRRSYCLCIGSLKRKKLGCIFDLYLNVVVLRYGKKNREKK
jgi:hypothetical protein